MHTHRHTYLYICILHIHRHLYVYIYIIYIDICMCIFINTYCQTKNPSQTPFHNILCFAGSGTGDATTSLFGMPTASSSGGAAGRVSWSSTIFVNTPVFWCVLEVMDGSTIVRNELSTKSNEHPNTCQTVLAMPLCFTRSSSPLQEMERILHRREYDGFFYFFQNIYIYIQMYFIMYLQNLVRHMYRQFASN